MLWLTNHAAPYRLPVWDELARERPKFQVWVLADNESNRLWGGLHQSRPYIRLVNTSVSHIGQRNFFWLRESLYRSYLNSDREGLVIGGWEHPAYWQASAIARWARIPRILFYESTPQTHQFTSGAIPRVRSAFMRFGAESVLVPGPAARRAVLQAGVPSQRVFETFNSIDEAAVRRAVADSARDVGGPLRICYVGQLIERKNVSSLISAFFDAALGESELNIVGQGPCEPLLRAEVRRREGVAGRSVIWHGGQSQAGALSAMVNCDVLVLPSHEEVWGLVVNEALTAGLRVVVNEVCGVYESVRDMDGVFPTDGSPQSIRAALEDTARASRGWIESPSIMHRGSPQSFAAQVDNALVGAKGRVNRRI